MVTDYRFYINGQFETADGGAWIESHNPANQELLARVPRGTASDIDRAVLAARHAFDHGPWPKMRPEERQKRLHALADKVLLHSTHLATLEAQDSGGTIRKTEGDMLLSAKQLKYFGNLATSTPLEVELTGMSRPGVSHNSLVYEPIGVCGQIIPWNFPLMMAVWKLGPALAAGCTVVLKPAEETPVTALELAKLIDECDFPPGVVNIVTGYGEEAGAALVSHPGVDKIAFTGSTETGCRIMQEAARTMKRVTLECGGKSANIILDDADPEIAIDGALYALFFHQGQCCTAGSRLLIPASQKDFWVDALVKRAQSMRLGDPMSRETDMGPLVSQAQLDRVLGFIESGKAEGATCLLGGHRAEFGDLKNGYFVEPTIFADVIPQMTIAQEEIFGPVLSILTYQTEAEAIEIANSTRYGLAAGVWSQDAQRADRVARQVKAGTVWINEYHMVSEKAPFGGFKQSGIGRELGPDSLRAYLEVKHLYVDELASREKKFWYDMLLKPRSLTKT